MPIIITPLATSYEVGDVPAGKGLATAIDFTVEGPAHIVLTVTTTGVFNASLEVLGWIKPGGVYVGGGSLNLGPDPVLALPVRLVVRAKTQALGIVPGDAFSATLRIDGIAGVEPGASDPITVSGTIVAATVNEAAIDLALDRSHYMDAVTTARTKAACLRLIEFMTEADWLGISFFAGAVIRKQNMKPLTAANKASALAVIGTLKHTTSNSSVFGAANSVVTSLNWLPELCACAPAGRAMVMVSMGQETVPIPVPPPVVSPCGKFAVALGATPGVLPSVTPDYFMLGDPAAPGEMFRLEKFLLQCLAEMSGSAVLLDPSGTLGEKEIKIPFDVADTESNVRILLLVDDPELVNLELAVEGERLPPWKYPGASLLRGQGSIEFALDRTVLEQAAPDEEPCKPRKRGKPEGKDVPQPLPSKTWHAILSLSESAVARAARLKPVPYTLVVFAATDLRFSASVHLDSECVGGTAFMTAWLSEHGAPVTGKRVRIWAEVTYPDKGTGVTVLKEGAEGRFQGEVRCTQPGPYRFRILAAGMTFRGKAFKRELTRTTFTQARATRDCQPCAPQLCGSVRYPERGAADLQHDPDDADREDFEGAGPSAARAPRGDDKAAQLGLALGKVVEALRLAKKALR